MQYDKLVLDCDNMIHIIAYKHWAAGNRDDEDSIRVNVKSFVNTILASSSSRTYLIVFQDVDFKNFRKEILPEYKSHRKQSDAIDKWKPIIIDELKKFHHLALKRVESDDALAILGTKYFKSGILMACDDKDIYQIAGTHYNPFKAKLVFADKFKTVTLVEGYKNLMLQTATSDSTDMPLALTGIDGVGPVKAKQLLHKRESTEWPSILSKAYMMKYGIAEGLKRMALTYEMVFLLRIPTLKYPETQIIYDATFVEYDSKKPTLETDSGSLFD